MIAALATAVVSRTRCIHFRWCSTSGTCWPLVSNCLTGTVTCEARAMAKRTADSTTMTRAATRRALRCAPLISHATQGPPGLSTRGAGLFQPCPPPHHGLNPRAGGRVLRHATICLGYALALPPLGTPHGGKSLRCRSTVQNNRANQADYRLVLPVGGAPTPALIDVRILLFYVL